MSDLLFLCRAHQRLTKATSQRNSKPQTNWREYQLPSGDVVKDKLDWEFSTDATEFANDLVAIAEILFDKAEDKENRITIEDPSEFPHRISTLPLAHSDLHFSLCADLQIFTPKGQLIPGDTAVTRDPKVVLRQHARDVYDVALHVLAPTLFNERQD